MPKTHLFTKTEEHLTFFVSIVSFRRKELLSLKDNLIRLILESVDLTPGLRSVEDIRVFYNHVSFIMKITNVISQRQAIRAIRKHTFIGLKRTPKDSSLWTSDYFCHTIGSQFEAEEKSWYFIKQFEPRVQSKSKKKRRRPNSYYNERFPSS